MAVATFFLGYRKVDLRPNEVIVSVHVPHTKPGEFLRPFKTDLIPKRGS